MKLLMAISSNGYAARGPVDDMKWTGPDDKAVFRLLTSTGDLLAASAQTVDQMPHVLEGRGRLYALSRDFRKGVSLEDFASIGQNAWLLGGPSLGIYALKHGFVDRVFLSIVPTEINSATYPLAIPDRIRPYLESRQQNDGRFFWWTQSARLSLGSVNVECWTRETMVQEN